MNLGDVFNTVKKDVNSVATGATANVVGGMAYDALTAGAEDVGEDALMAAVVSQELWNLGDVMKTV